MFASKIQSIVRPAVSMARSSQVVAASLPARRAILPSARSLATSSAPSAASSAGSAASSSGSSGASAQLSAWARIKRQFAEHPAESAIALVATTDVLYLGATMVEFDVAYVLPSLAVEPWGFMRELAQSELNLVRTNVLGWETLEQDSAAVTALASASTVATALLPALSLGALALVPRVGPRFVRPVLSRLGSKKPAH